MATQEIDFTAGMDSHPNDPHVATPGRVRPVAVPPAARTLGTLPHIDDEDAFLVETGPTRTGRASNGPERSWRTLRSSCDARSAGAGSRPACGSVQFGPTDSCHARWAGVAPVHRLVVRYLLERASRRIRERSETDER